MRPIKTAIGAFGKGLAGPGRSSGPSPDLPAPAPAAGGSRASRRLGAGGALAAALLLAGCGGPLSTLDPAGPEASSVARLWWVMLAGSAVLFALVMALFALVMLRPGFGRGVSAERWIVAGGLAMPLPVLLALLIYALIAGEGMVRPAAGEQAFRVEAVGRMWDWEFSYPDHPEFTPTLNILHIPAGERIEVAMTSEDVIHSFWIPRLAGKLDAIPGRINTLRITADAPGNYGGLCAEYCGIGHAGMSFEVVAHGPEDFAALLAGAGDLAAGGAARGGVDGGDPAAADVDAAGVEDVGLEDVGVDDVGVDADAGDVGGENGE